MYALAGLIGAAVAAVVWTRRHPRAYPPVFAFLLDTPLRDVLLSRAELARQLALAPPMRVLEIGPGSGFYTEPLVTGHRDVEFVCLDLQPPMLHNVRRRLGARTPHLVCGSASALPFRGGSVDRIFLVSVLGEVPDRASALRECARLLSDGGTLLVAEALVDPDYIRPSVLVREASNAGLVAGDRVGSWASYTQRFARAARAPAAESRP
jgi:ubiquinone/menaquinone biosynthesis C-methylase UbiE